MQQVASPHYHRRHRGPPSFDHGTTDVDQTTVLHAARQVLAVAAGQAAIEMLLRLRRRLDAFEHLFDQVDAATRSSSSSPST